MQGLVASKAAGLSRFDIGAPKIRDIDFGRRRTRLWPNAPPTHARQLVSAPRVPATITIMVDRFEWIGQKLLPATKSTVCVSCTWFALLRILLPSIPVISLATAT